MESETHFIADQLRRSVGGDAWHGPSLLEVTEGVDDEIAGRRLGEQTHTIREIVMHVIAWETAVLDAVNGVPMPPLDQPWEGDWPISQDPWPALQAGMKRVCDALAKAIAGWPAEKLNQAVPGRDGYTFRFLLHGLVQHNVYHAGQIALLRK
jgi:uncharacterized damage-inducible protein DinB